MCAICALSAVGSPAASGATRIRVDVAAFPTLAVSVDLPHGSSSAPRVYENGRRVKLLSASNVGEAPIIALVVDRSRSMHGKALRNAIGVAQSFLATKPARDRIAVFAVGSKTIQLTPFSRSRRRAGKALRSLRLDPQSGTALYDGIVRASGALRRQHGAGKVIILITDGQNTPSQTDVADAYEAASAANAAVYPVAIANSTYRPGTLDLLARATGGAFLGAPTKSSSSAYSAIVADIRRTWRLVYVSTSVAGDRVGVRVSEPGSSSVGTSLTIPRGVTNDSVVSNDELFVVAIAGVMGIALLWLRPRRSKYATRRRLS
jgi:VWFA-related protein